MKILCIGDIVGSGGCEFLRMRLPSLKKELEIDFVVANGENSADGNGITPVSAGHLFTSGVNVITGGNHTFRRREIFPLLESDEYLLRPANFHRSAPGKGICIADMGRIQVAVINIMGVSFIENYRCPFDTAEEMIEEAHNLGAKIILIDFHAEATAEKRAMGFFLDGKVSALFGTHTHVQTADAQVMSSGTGYITDLGMTGPLHSVLGVKPELAIEKQRTKLPVRFENAAGEQYLCGCVFEIDEKTGLALSAKAIQIYSSK